MPRVHYVKAARKDNAVVKKGQPYYYWEFRHGGKRMSATHPKQSQLTQSAYKQALYGLQEQIESSPMECADDVESLKQDAITGLEELRDEQQEKLDNMAEYNLENSPAGELVQERYDALESAISEMDSVDFDYEEDEDLDEEENAEALQEKLDEVRDRIVEVISEANV